MNRMHFQQESHKTLHYTEAQKQRSPSSQLSLNKIVIASAWRMSGSYLYLRHANLLPFIFRFWLFLASAVLIIKLTWLLLVYEREGLFYCLS